MPAVRQHSPTAELGVRAIIPDERTNSLIIVASEAAYAAIKRMLTPCRDPPADLDDFDYVLNDVLHGGYIGHDGYDDLGPIELPVGPPP